MKKVEHKYPSLDGLRGMAALMVVLLHYVCAFAPFLLGVSVTTRHTRIDHLITTTPLQIPFAGGFAVSVFFVLSGFVLSLSFFKYKSVDVLTSSASRRYFRLMIPAFGSVMLAYIVMRFGWLHYQQAATISQSTWLAAFWHFPANFVNAVYQGVYGAFFTIYSNSNIAYNPVLWTMHFELFGSFMVFMFLALFGKQRNRPVFYGLFALMFLKTYYLGFLAGMAIADTYINYPKLKNALSDRVLWLLLPVAVVLGTWTVYTTAFFHVHMWRFTEPQIEGLANVLGAVIVVFAVLRLSRLSRLFETRPLQYLGKISFSLYLVHFTIMASLGSYLFSHYTPLLGYKLGVLVAFGVSMVVTFAASHLYTRYVDTPSIIWSKQLGNFLLNGSLSFQKLSSIRRFARNQVPLLAKRAIVEIEESAKVAPTPNN